MLIFYIFVIVGCVGLLVATREMKKECDKISAELKEIDEIIKKL